MARETYRMCRRPNGIFDLVPLNELDAWVKKWRPERSGASVKMPKKVQRGAWICVPGPDGHVRFIPKVNYAPATKAGLQIIKDIEPFQNVAIDNGVIGGRKQKRDMMRAHNLIEVGNERPTARHNMLPGDRVGQKQINERVANTVNKAWYKLTGEY